MVQNDLGMGSVGTPTGRVFVRKRSKEKRSSDDTAFMKLKSVVYAGPHVLSVALYTEYLVKRYSAMTKAFIVSLLWLILGVFL